MPSAAIRPRRRIVFARVIPVLGTFPWAVIGSKEDGLTQRRKIP